MPIPYTNKVNARLTAVPISGELHTIGIIGAETVAPNTIRLIEVPEQAFPSTVIITGVHGPYSEGVPFSISLVVSATELAVSTTSGMQPNDVIVQGSHSTTITVVIDSTHISVVDTAGFTIGPAYDASSGTPTGGQFIVNYTTGVITFSASQNGNAVSASYNGLGSEIAAEDINELQHPVGIALNYNGTLSTGVAVTSIGSDANPTLTDGVLFLSGTNVTLSQAGNTITINATGGGGGGTLNIRTVATSVIPTSLDYTLLVNAASGPISINLPLASSTNGKLYDIKKIDSSVNVVTIATSGADLIDGSSTFPMSAQYQSTTVQAQGVPSGWWVL